MILLSIFRLIKYLISVIIISFNQSYRLGICRILTVTAFLFVLTKEIGELSIDFLSIDNYHLLFLLDRLLLLSGDIETNPGPAQINNDIHSVSVFHQNIRSIRNKFDYISENFLDFDILCFTETKLVHTITDESLSLDGFGSMYRKDNTANSGGLLTYVSNHLYSKRILEMEHILPESLWIQLKDMSKSYLICNLYRPPNSTVELWNRLNICIDKALEFSNRIIIVGDINEDQLNLNNHKFKDILMLNNMSNVICDPTRVSQTSSTLIDPIAITSNIHCLHAGTFNTDKRYSDHYGTFIYFKADFVSRAPFKRRVWNYKEANFTLLNEKILTTDWTFISNTDIDTATEEFTKTLITLAQSCIPTRFVTIRPNDKPWYNSEIRRTSRQRDRQRKIAQLSGKSADWLTFKNLRNKVNNMKKHAKEIFFNNIEFTISDLNSNNPRQYWKLVKMLIKDHSGCETIPPLANTRNKTLAFSDKDKANALNDFFSSISTVDDSNVNLPLFTSKSNNQLVYVAVSEQDVKDVLSNLVINKANGPDEVSHRLLKETRETICKPLTILFNKSIQHKVYPKLWKQATVMPLFKKGDKSMPSNYRPVSLISCVGKVMERIMFKYIYNFLQQNELIYKHQSGFLPNHSTVYQLIDIYNQICKAFDEKKFTCIVFCDISKAFDRVWHKGLLFKLKQLGISGHINEWFASYLSNRKQRVFVGTELSQEKTINAGVPQGSVLGPLLFLIYVNDIAESLSSITRLFADDSSLAVSSNNVQFIENILNQDLQRIADWAKQWLVNFNPSKTEALFLSLSRTNRIPPDLYFQNTQLTFVESHTHLGVSLSSDGSWHTHISNITSSASKVLGTMRALKYKLKRNTLNHLYLTYLRPILEYASILWDSCTINEKETIEKIQYEAARIVTGLTRSVSIERLLKEIGWVSLADRRKIQKLVLVYKHKNGELPEYLSELYPNTISQTNTYRLRDRENYATVVRRLEIYSKSVIPSSIKLWNDLDPDIRNSNSVSQFKSKIKNMFKPHDVPSYFVSGERVLQMLHARIRNSCSNLNADLCDNHLRDNPSCECGFIREDAEHYFFRCPLYTNQRRQLFISTRTFHPLSSEKLLFGIENRSDEDNTVIFEHVQQFIKATKRFEN